MHQQKINKITLKKREIESGQRAKQSVKISTLHAHRFIPLKAFFARSKIKIIYQFFSKIATTD